jgi:phosphoribosyl 1,2-cyclic phosphate phosphodiesterase
MGVPTLGCTCRVCTSTDPRDRRTRPSIAVTWAGHRVVIDTGPDFRMQALREGIDHVDAVLYTHSHADHILGLDDLRPLSFKHKNKIPLYADDDTANVIERIFDYTFDPDSQYPTRARVEMHRLGRSVEIGETSLALLENLDVVILDALRKTAHSSHATLEQAVGFVNRMRPRRAFFTHMSHDLLHAETNNELPENIQLAYDGLRIPFEI